MFLSAPYAQNRQRSIYTSVLLDVFGTFFNILKAALPVAAVGNRRLRVARLSDGPPVTFGEKDGCLSVRVFVWMDLRIAYSDLLCRCGVTFVVKS